jgi:hypothetical protein
MPQLDFYSFFIQIIWFSFFSLAIYLVYLKFFLKNISVIVKLRQKLINLVGKLNKKIPVYLVRDYVKKYFF